MIKIRHLVLILVLFTLLSGGTHTIQIGDINLSDITLFRINTGK